LKGENVLLNFFKRIQLYHAVVFGAYIVFGCNMIISYYHAWEQFSRVGDFPGKLAHVAVVAFDTVFALAVLVISTGIMRGVKIGWPVWMAGLFGLSITTWSNVRASMGEEWILLVSGQWRQISATGWESCIAGMSTPTSLVAIEFLLAWMVANRSLFENAVNQMKQVATQPDKEDDQPAETKSQPGEVVHQPVETENLPAKEVEQPVETDAQPAESPDQPDEADSQPVEEVEPPTEEELRQRAIDFINSYREENNGKYPGRRKVHEHSGLSQHKSNELLKEIKTKAEQESAGEETPKTESEQHERTNTKDNDRILEVVAG
jgi:hypothetical protein